MRDVREAVQADLAAAAASLQARFPLSDDDVHDARKALKRARAGLRLLRDAVGEKAYAAENRRLRDAARPLARARDLGGMLELAPAPLCAALRAEQAEALRALDVAPIVRALEQSARRVGRWPSADAKAALRGFARIYRSGRRALAASRRSASVPLLHESRKQMKHLANALLLVEPKKPVKRLAKRIDDVTEQLGQDRDLALLAERAPALRPRTARQRERLQRKALEEGARLYRRKPSSFVRRLA